MHSLDVDKTSFSGRHSKSARSQTPLVGCRHVAATCPSFDAKQNQNVGLIAAQGHLPGCPSFTDSEVKRKVRPSLLVIVVPIFCFLQTTTTTIVAKKSMTKCLGGYCTVRTVLYIRTLYQYRTTVLYGARGAMISKVRVLYAGFTLTTVPVPVHRVRYEYQAWQHNIVLRVLTVPGYRYLARFVIPYIRRCLSFGTCRNDSCVQELERLHQDCGGGGAEGWYRYVPVVRTYSTVTSYRYATVLPVRT